MKKYIFLVLAMFLVSANLTAYMVLNDTDPVFPEPERSEISGLIIDGAVGFIDSYSEALLVLKEYELSAKNSFNITVAFQKIDSALIKLEESRSKYAKTIETGEKVEYVNYYQNKLETYDYNKFKSEHSLNKEIADEVIAFLEKGDVLGLYRRNLENIDAIIVILKDIKTKLNNNVKPDISVFWSLLQKYSEAGLFGNYATVLSLESFGG